MEQHELYLEFYKISRKPRIIRIDLELETESDFLLKVNHVLNQENTTLILDNTEKFLNNDCLSMFNSLKIQHVLKDLLESKNSKVIIDSTLDSAIMAKNQETLENRFSYLQEIFQKIQIEIPEKDLQDMCRKLKTRNELELVAREIYIARKINRNLDISKICKMALSKNKSSHIEKCTIPVINIKDIYGLAELDKINSVVGFSEKRGILIHGDSGVGKSALAFALINESGMDCIYVDAPRIRSKIVGESEKNILDVFKQAKACRPCVILVDQIDMILPIRGSNDSSENTGDRITACFLADTSFASENLSESIFIIGITNRLDAVDPSVYRHGRLDHLIHIPMPDFQSRKLIFTGFLSKMPNNLSNSDIDDLAAATSAWTGADIENLLRETALGIIRKNNGIFSKDLHLAPQDFDLNAS